MTDPTPDPTPTTWPDWTAITTTYNGPAETDPDHYTATCYRCQTAQQEPWTHNGTRDECITWAQGHADDPEHGEVNA
ncbi:hypothetical protein [Amycolatopsis sp. NPDC004378]